MEKMIKIRSNSFYQCGIDVGKKEKEHIKRECGNLLARHDSRWIFVGLRLLKKNAKNTYDYIRGLAKGSSVPFINVFMSWYEELPKKEKTPIVDKGCTDISFRFGDIGSILLHTNDVEADLENSMFELEISGYPKVTFIGFNGSPSVAVNSLGFVFSGNQIDANDERPGVPRLCLLFESLFCSSFEEIIKILLNKDRASSYNNIISNKYGDIITLEASALDESIVHHKDESVIVHTNNFIYLPEKELRDDMSFVDSQVRLERTIFEVEKVIDDMSINRVFDLLKTHGEGGVCRHKTEDSEITTNFSVIFIPTKRIFLYANGAPCNAEYQKYEY